MPTPDGATPVGDNFYMFKSTQNLTDCVISAHGGYLTTTDAFLVGNCEIRFYSLHDESVRFDIAKFLIQKPRHVAWVPSGQRCINYGLSKAQGNHTLDDGRPQETYGTVHTNVDLADAGLSAGVLAAGGGSVLTIRNRLFRPDVTLKAAVDAVMMEMPTIRRIHCPFCRTWGGPGWLGNILGKPDEKIVDIRTT